MHCLQPIDLMSYSVMCTLGGSAVGSDAIYQEVMKVRRAGKPVVVSMGNLAASGGYYISGHHLLLCRTLLPEICPVQAERGYHATNDIVDQHNAHMSHAQVALSNSQSRKAAFRDCRQ